MKQFKRDFITFLIQEQVLTFGSFTLKSGRISPVLAYSFTYFKLSISNCKYFFNAGKFNTGTTLLKLSRFYADALFDSGLEYDVLFGPAYKGIPLVTSLCIALASKYSLNLPFCFNRKEIKDHGEGGNLVGHALIGRILVVDDVITAGTAIRECVSIIKDNKAIFYGALIALDRQEIVSSTNNLSAIQQVEQEFNVKVVSIVNLGDIVEYLREIGGYTEELSLVVQYRIKYGIKV